MLSILNSICLALAASWRAHASPAWPHTALRAADDCVIRSYALSSLTVLYTRIVNSQPLDKDGSLIAFQLQNDAANFGAMCSANAPSFVPSAANNGSFPWYSCFIESRDDERAASFQYVSTSNQLTLNVTWACGGRKNISPVRFEALGTGSLAAACGGLPDSSNSGGQQQCNDESASGISIPVKVSTRK